MAIHSSILAWRIPQTEESGEPVFMGLQRVGHDWATSTQYHLYEVMRQGSWTWGCQTTKYILLNNSIFEKWKWKSLSHVWLFVIAWAVACQTPLSMEFSRLEYWNGYPFPLLQESSQPRNLTRVSCIVGRFFTSRATGKPLIVIIAPTVLVMWTLLFSYYSLFFFFFSRSHYACTLFALHPTAFTICEWHWWRLGARILTFLNSSYLWMLKFFRTE